MKQLTCEMCGSTDIAKQDGFFVCQTCGMKYSVEDAKKMMIEGTVDVQGTVKVDNSAFVEKYLANARRAKQKEDWEETEKYYNMVEQNDPTNIEAIFYSSYGKAKRSLVESDIYKREAAFKVLQNCVSVIDDNYDYEDDKEIDIIEQISDDIINMACSSYVYNQTKNGYGVVTQTDKYRTVTLFNNLGLAFTDSLDHIIDGYGENEKAKKIKLLKLALTHVEFILKNGSLQNPTQVRGYVANYHQKIHALDPSHPIKTEQEMKIEALPNTATSAGWGKYKTICMIIFCLFPITGEIISGTSLYSANKGTMTNINTQVAKTTLIINIIATILIPLIAIISLA